MLGMTECELSTPLLHTPSRYPTKTLLASLIYMMRPQVRYWAARTWWGDTVLNNNQIGNAQVCQSIFQSAGMAQPTHGTLGVKGVPMSVSHGGTLKVIAHIGFLCLCGVCKDPRLTIGFLNCSPSNFKAKFLIDAIGHFSEAG